MNSLLNSKKELVVLEIANNHQGDLEHGKNIISEFSNITKKYTDHFDFSIKFQYRDLKTFIHPKMTSSDIKYVKRFLSTELSENDFLELKNFAENKKFISMCTPFDEISVSKVINHNYNILKIASASLTDWPLIEEVGKYKNQTIIASVGGSSLNEISRFYSYMKNRNINFALNYCVSLYPTKPSQLNLSFINILKSNFPDIRIGFSTHEGPETLETAGLALHAGATIFEKHIALENKEKNYFQNDYSVNPIQFENWINKLLDAKTIFGTISNRKDNLTLENSALRPLKRGVYVKKDIPKQKIFDFKDLFFAIPNLENQLLANDLSKFSNIKSLKKLKSQDHILYEDVEIDNNRNYIENIRDRVKNDFIKNKIVVPNGLDLEISHHYGIDRFENFGTTMCTLVNNEYCKKIIYQFPKQTNPEHYHKIKEETFILIEGDLVVNVDEKIHNLNKGDMLTILPYQKHSFFSKNGAIFEEISTKHLSDDSFYTDKKIQNNPNRKSKILFY